jgi:hypothetical protein
MYEMQQIHAESVINKILTKGLLNELMDKTDSIRIHQSVKLSHVKLVNK